MPESSALAGRPVDKEALVAKMIDNSRTRDDTRIPRLREHQQMIVFTNFGMAVVSGSNSQKRFQ
jgi:hypothetical protein